MITSLIMIASLIRCLTGSIRYSSGTAYSSCPSVACNRTARCANYKLIP